MSPARANPIHNQSQPFKGKTMTYIKVVHGTKTKPAMPTSQGKFKVANAAFTLIGASNQ
jgi:hypothetical protein